MSANDAPFLPLGDVEPGVGKSGVAQSPCRRGVEGGGSVTTTGLAGPFPLWGVDVLCSWMGRKCGRRSEV